MRTKKDKIQFMSLNLGINNGGIGIIYIDWFQIHQYIMQMLSWFYSFFWFFGTKNIALWQITSFLLLMNNVNAFSFVCSPNFRLMNPI